ncbi:ABC transporter ATP-binding protein [Agrobacterium rhizogenes]|nr:ABC transporter ATP-binding protein [Rhizobium rhizogenes]NTJ80996.1 ABC transporter ATP-binding protein [Rhizobium rhizogenes]
MAELLRIESLSAGYGKATVLHGVSLSVEPGTSVALLGRNGVGKTTTLNTIVGLTRYRSGSIRLRGTDIQGMSPERRVEAGIGWVPQERGIFRSLTVEENITAVARPGRWTLSAIYDLFPRLKERRSNLGNQLSGGEQQMLSIGRALVLNPILLLLDEPTEGLAPIIVEELLAAIRRIVRAEGLAAIIVEQHAQQLLAITDKAIILDRGSVAYSGDSGHLAEDRQTLGKFLGVGATE